MDLHNIHLRALLDPHSLGELVYTCSTPFLVYCIYSDAFIFSVVTGTGELDTYKEPEADVEVVHQPPVCPYLLLDLRDKDDYDKCHIISGE